MILRQSIGLRINQAAIWRQILFGGAVALSMSQALLANETDGLAWVTNDEAVSDYGSLTIKDTVTPANNYSGAPFDFDGGPLVFSRASLAMDLGADGLWKYTPHNLILQSQTFATTWTNPQGVSTISSDDTTAPDGTLTADKVVPAATTLVHGRRQAFNFTNGVQYTFEFRFKPTAAGINAEFYASDTTSIFGGVFNTTALTLVDAVLITGSAAADENGFIKCTAVFTATNTAVGLVDIRLTRATTRNQQFVGDAVEGAWMWGAHIHATPMRGDYITDRLVTTTAAVYRPKIYRDPVTLDNPRYWPEPASTNLALYSSVFSEATWIKTFSTVTSNAIVGPFGTTTADKLANSTTAGVNRQAYQIGKTITSGVPYTASAFLKAGELSWGVINIYDTTDTDRRCYFNLSTGVVGTVAAGCTASIQPAANGFYRCIVTKTSAATSGGISIEWSNADNTSSFAGTAGEGIYAEGAQYEAGSVATSPIETLGASVTRARDQITAATTEFNHSATAFTVYWEALLLGDILNGSPIWQLSQSATELSVGIFQSNTVQAAVTAGGVNVAVLNAGALVAGTAYKHAFSAAANDFALVRDGGAPVTDPSGAMPTKATSLNICYNIHSPTSMPYVALGALMVLPRAMSTAEKQALTA